MQLQKHERLPCVTSLGKPLCVCVHGFFAGWSLKNTIKQLTYGSFVYYRIYLYELADESSASDAKANRKDDVGSDRGSRGFLDALFLYFASHLSRCRLHLTSADVYDKTIKVWFLHVLSDLSVLACGRVTKNSTRGRRPSGLFLVTPLQARMDKSDNTLWTIL